MAGPIIATKQMIQEMFDGAAPDYDRHGPPLFQVFGERLIETLAPQQGSHLLDVATGTGAVLVPAARRVGPAGHVTGIDLAPAILSEAEREVRSAGLTNVTLRSMDAERLEYADGSFDAVTCAFALFMLPDMAAGLREIIRVCKTGGQVGISVFARSPVPFDPGWPIFGKLADEYGVGVRLPQRVVYTPAEAGAVLSTAGLREIRTESETYDLVYADEETWWAFQHTLGSRATILGMQPDERELFRRTYFERLRPYLREDGFHFQVGVVYAVGSK